MARPRTLAFLSTAVTAAALGGALAMALRWPDIDLVQVATTVALVLPAAVVGLVVAIRRPDNAVGPLISLQGTVFALMFGWQGAYDGVVLAHPGAVPAWPVLAALERGSWMVLYVPAGLLMLTFPRGRLLNRRWRWIAGGLVAVAVLFTVIATMSPRPLSAPFAGEPNPLGVAPVWLRAVGWALLPAFLLLLVASAASMVLRYRRSADRIERVQVRWLALGAWSLPATLLLCWLSLLLLGRPDLTVVGLAFVDVAIPAVAAVAMLRHDLYDVDRALSVAATYSILSGILLTVFTVSEIAAGAVLGRGSGVVAAAATAGAAVVLTPARKRARRLVDQRLYPMRTDLQESLRALRGAIDGGTSQPEDVERVLRRSLHAPQLRVGYFGPGDDVATTASGARVASGVPVQLAGVRIGLIEPGATPASRELLREAADGAALFIELARLRLGMARAMAEIRTSRNRLLLHGYQERRSLQRDLHDGAQQRLVALGLSLRLAQRHLHDDGFDVDGLLDQAMAQLGTAVAELRTIAAGLRPPALDSGLAAAVRSLVATVPLPVELALCDDQVPDDVATTAYYVVSEGLTNAIKHACATRVSVALTRCNGDLSVEVRDDGVGGARRTGSGLAGLADRVAAASGDLRVTSPVGSGTRLEAVLPCGS